MSTNTISFPSDANTETVSHPYRSRSDHQLLNLHSCYFLQQQVQIKSIKFRQFIYAPSDTFASALTYLCKLASTHRESLTIYTLLIWDFRINLFPKPHRSTQTKTKIPFKTPSFHSTHKKFLFGQVRFQPKYQLPLGFSLSLNYYVSFFYLILRSIIFYPPFSQLNNIYYSSMWC